jgi:hypothetical protein
MRKPIQFNPDDWIIGPELRAASLPAKGIWATALAWMINGSRKGRVRGRSKVLHDYALANRASLKAFWPKRGNLGSRTLSSLATAKSHCGIGNT